MPEGGRREDLYNVYIDVTFPTGVVTFQCDKLSPLGVKAKSATYRPSNGLENELVLGGPRKLDPVTLTALYSPLIDTWVSELLAYAGRAPVTVRKVPLDENGKPFGKKLSSNGKLEDFATPPTDSESEKPALCTFTCVLETNIA